MAPRSLYIVCLVALAVTIAPRGTLAQESLRFAHLSVDDGLSQSSVQHILQDRRGLLWFGTQEGLNRYDGYRFTVHRARDQDGFLRDHDVTAMAEDREGDLWIGTSRGLYRYDLDTGRFDTCAPPVSQLGILELVAADDGRLHVVTSDGRLWVLESGNGQCRARPVSEGPFTALRGVTALAPAAGSAVWAAAGGGLMKVDAGADASRGHLVEVLPGIGAVTVLARDGEGHIWIGRPDAELLRYRPADGRIDRFPQAPRLPLAVLPARGGAVWIGARGGGLWRLDPRTGSIAAYRHDPDDPSSLSGDNVAAIYEDAAGSLWIGTWNGGVDHFDPHTQAFRTLRRRPRTPDSLPANDVTAMVEAPDRTLWLASRSGLVMSRDPRSGRFRTAATIPISDRPLAIGWWDRHVLIGTVTGLVTLDAVSGRAVPLDPALRAHGLGERRISSIRTAPDAVWIGSGTGVVRVIRREAFAPVTAERVELHSTGSVSALSVVQRDGMWIGTDTGEVLRVEWGGSGVAAIRALPLGPPARASLESHGHIGALHEDRQGGLWIGTRRGLGRLDVASGQLVWLGEQDGLPSTNISGIAADPDGRLWVGHNRGLTRIDPAGGAMMHFGDREGAQGKGYAEGAWATGGSGLVYFAGEGVTMFDPREVRTSPNPPRVVFTALEVLRRVVSPEWLEPGSPLQRTIDAQEEVTLGPDATVFSVEMAPLHYVDPPGNRLMYRLEGFDPDWIETGAHNRVATYTNLAPGRYVLRARAGTRNGLWSERDVTLAITIRPPWWRTRSALAGWIALELAGAALIWTALRRRARVRQALLEREDLRRDSVTDPLTGLHNRRFLTSYLQHEIPRVLREYRGRGSSAAGSDDDLLLVLVDVDHFKSINDRHSHAAGDRALTRIAEALKGQIRDSDLAVRWGGDEFLIVMRGFRRASAADYAERVRAAVEAAGRTLADAGGPASTVSIGFAAFPFVTREPDALTWEQTLDLSDHALRLTKRRRRNSHTGLRARDGVTAREVLAFLAGAPLPSGVEIVTPDET